MVSTDRKPEMTVGGPQAWFAENGDEFVFAMILGMILGIIISFAYCKFKKYKSQKDKTKSDE